MKEKIMKFLTPVWTVISSKTFAYVILGVILFFAFRTCNSEKDAIAEKVKTEQNLLAMNDTVKIYKNKYNETVAEKTVLILSEKELKSANSELYDKVKQQEGSILSLNMSVIGLKQDTSILKQKLRAIAGIPTQLNDSTWRLPFDLNYNWDAKNYDRYIGETKVQINTTSNATGVKPTINVKNLGTILTNRESSIDVTFGDKVVDNKYVVFLQSSYPGFTAKSLEGYSVDPNTNKYLKQLMKKQHWFTGFSVGFGVTPGYNVIGNNFGITVGPTVVWNIFNW